MKFFKISLFCLFHFFSLVEICAQSENHLEPLDRSFDVSERDRLANSKISKKLDIKSYRPTLRFIIVPSFSETSFLDMYSDGEKDYLIYLKKDVIHKTEIDSISAGQMESLFNIAIHETRYNRELETSFSVDGTSFFLFLDDGYVRKGGQTWSPSKDTPMWKLITISNDFIELACTGKLVVFSEDLIKRIGELKKELLREHCDCLKKLLNKFLFLEKSMYYENIKKN